MLLVGCAEGDPTLEGYVTAIELDELLVSTKDGEAMWFYGLTDNTEVGDYVEIWGVDIEQSDPPRAQAITLYGSSSEMPTGARLTEKQALQQALNQTYIPVPVMQRLQYKDDIWYFEFEDAETSKKYELEVYE